MPDALSFPKVPKPELDEPGPRKPLTKFQYATIFLDQQGKCFSCGEKLQGGKVIDEHLVPRETLPADRCDALENRRLFCASCAKKKTVGDQAVIAKSRRVRGERGSQVAKRKIRGPSIQGRKEIATRGFEAKPDGYKVKWPTRKVRT
jgi:hypothetical protein